MPTSRLSLLTWIGIGLLGLCIAGRNANADEPVLEQSPAIDAEWQIPLQQFASFLADLSADRMEDAWQKFQKMTPHPQPAAATPFDADPLLAFKKSLGRFPPDIENLNVIAERRWTANSRRFYLLCDTQAGPVMVDVMIYRSKEHWYFGTLSYHVLLAANKDVARQAEDLVPLNRYPIPMPLTLTTESTSEKMTAR